MNYPYHWLGALAESAEVLESYETRSPIYSPAPFDLDDPQCEE